MTDGITSPPGQHHDNKLKPRPNIHHMTEKVASQNSAPVKVGKPALTSAEVNPVRVGKKARAL